jgi:hypothetical protein
MDKKFVQMVVLVIHRVMLVCLLGGRLNGLVVIRKGSQEIERAKEIMALMVMTAIYNIFFVRSNK